MDGMGMSGGMDMGSVSMFKETNMRLARLYWYLVAATVSLLGLRRLVEWTRKRYASGQWTQITAISLPDTDVHAA
jgi:hypothetical protein